MATKMKEAKENMDRAATEFENTDYNVFKQGAAYDGLKKSYEQQGRMAMQDTIGQVAARTGGMASSFAQTAGQQSYNGYMQTLEDAARSMFESERQQKMNEFGIASSIYDRENSDYRYDKEWEYQKGRDKISDDRYKAESDYAMGRDKIADARYDDAAAAELEAQAQSDVMTIWATGGNPSVDLLKAAGWYDESATTRNGGLSALGEAYYKQATAPSEEKPEFNPVSFEESESYSTMMNEATTQYEAESIVDLIIAATGNEDFAYALYEMWERRHRGDVENSQTDNAGLSPEVDIKAK